VNPQIIANVTTTPLGQMKLREKTTSAMNSTETEAMNETVTEAMNETVTHRTEDVTSVKKKDIINVTVQERHQRNIQNQEQFHRNPIELLGVHRILNPSRRGSIWGDKKKSNKIRNWNPDSNKQSEQSTWLTRNSSYNSKIHVNNVNTNNQYNFNKNVINVNTIQKTYNKDKANPIRGLCTIDGKIKPFLADLEQAHQFRPITTFGEIAITANGDELQITGRRHCEIQLGETSCSTGLLVSKEVSGELLMGIDFLTACEITRPHVEGLREATMHSRGIRKIERKGD
jgi:hypothetical protein